MSVRAKFYVAEITQSAGVPGGRVKLSAVVRGDGNAQWASATPVGNLEMIVNNPDAFGFFKSLVDRSMSTDAAAAVPPEVYLTLERAERIVPGDGHPFRAADVPEGHYMSGRCGDCGGDHPGE